MKFLFIGLFSFVFLGCGAAQKVEPSSQSQKNKPTQQNYESLGMKFEDSFNDGTDFFESRFDYKTFSKRVWPELEPKKFDEVYDLLRKKKRARQALKDGSYSYLRTALYDGQTYLFYRLIFEGRSETFLYFGLELNPEKPGYVSDILYFNTASSYSAVLRGVRDMKLGHLSMQKVIAALKSFRSDPEQAIDVWHTMPEPAKKIQVVHAGYVNTLARSSHRVEYEKQFFDYEEKYPEHYSTLFLALDFYFIMKRFPNYYEAVDIIEESFGRDPYLDLLRSWVLYEEKKVEEAYALVKKSIDDDPSIVEVWEQALVYSLELKKFADARSIFETLTDAGYEWDINVLKTDKDYADFMKSKEGIGFLKSLEQKTNN